CCPCGGGRPGRPLRPRGSSPGGRPPRPPPPRSPSTRRPRRPRRRRPRRRDACGPSPSPPPPRRRRSPTPTTTACLSRLDSDQLAPLGDEVLEPQIGELLLHRVLPEAVVQVLPVDLVEVLVLVEAGKHDLLEPTRRRVDVLLQALGADFLHHALHRRVDAADADVARGQVWR